MMRPARAGAARGRQGGVGMIEVLVAIVLVALGVLAISRMQTNVVRANHSALLRSQASLLVYDLVDRMRVDRENAIAGVYNRAYTDSAPTAGTLAGDELGEWLTRVGEQLPAGQGQVTQNGDRITVAVRWDDTRGEEALQEFATSTQL